MRREHPVLDVHSWIERKLVDPAQDNGLVASLLGVFGHQHRPTCVERCIEIIVAAMDVQGVLGKSAGTDFDYHGTELAGSVVILLHRVNDSLAGSKIDRPAAGHSVRCGAALSR